MHTFIPSQGQSSLGKFTDEASVLNLLDLYADPLATPYVPSYDWGKNEWEKSRDDFVREVVRGEAALSLEGANPMKFVRDIGATITVCVTCRSQPDTAPLLLQEYRRRADGSVVGREHPHTSISEKLLGDEFEALGLSHEEDWVAWWDRVCSAYEAQCLDRKLSEVLQSILARLIWEELQLSVTPNDIGPMLVRFVPVKVWARKDKTLNSLQPDGTYPSDSYPGMWTRNRLLCMEWDMPAMSLSGVPLYKKHGYAEPGTNHLTRWISKPAND